MVNKKIRNIRAVYIRNRNIVVKFRETGHQMAQWVKYMQPRLMT